MWAMLLTFLLGYMASTATAGSDGKFKAAQGNEQPLEPVRESELTKELHNKNISARWKSADLGVKLPTYFTDTKSNVVNRSASTRCSTCCVIATALCAFCSWATPMWQATVIPVPSSKRLKTPGGQLWQIPSKRVLNILI